MKAKKDVKKIYKSGESLVITLPPDFTENVGLSAGDQVEVFFNEFLKLRPVSQAEIEEELEDSVKKD